MKRFLLVFLIVIFSIIAFYSVALANSNANDGDYIEVEEPNNITKFSEDIADDEQEEIIYCTDSENVLMTVQLNGKYMEYAHEYEVSAGDEIVASASSKNGPIAFVGYYYVLLNEEEHSDEQIEFFKQYRKIVDVYDSTLKIVVPEFESGTKLLIWIEAVDVTDDGSENRIAKTGWQGFYIDIV